MRDRLPILIFALVMAAIPSLPGMPPFCHFTSLGNSAMCSGVGVQVGHSSLRLIFATPDQASASSPTVTP